MCDQRDEVRIDRIHLCWGESEIGDVLRHKHYSRAQDRDHRTGERAVDSEGKHYHHLRLRPRPGRDGAGRKRRAVQGNPRYYDGLDRGFAEAWFVIACCPSEPIAQKSLETLPTVKAHSGVV